MNEIKEKAKAIREWFTRCDIARPDHQKALHRAVLIVYSRQTSDEQTSESTRHRNNRGFNGTDARFGTFLAKSILDIQSGISQYQSLSPKMYAGILRMIPKYSAQIAEATIEGK